MTEVYDRSALIRDSVTDVKFTLFLAVCLVVLVIFIFLRNLSATVIPSIALPMSIVGTFAVMYVLNYTLDNLSLMALTLSVGFVVDDAIVMLENIVRHMEMGEGPMEAALKGSKEIGFTIVSMTLSLAAVFIPVLFMGGIIGRLLHEFSVVIMMAVLVSGFVSLSLTPMLCSRFLRAAARREARPALYGAGAIFRAAAEGLRRLAAMVAAAARVRDGDVRHHPGDHGVAILRYPEGISAGGGLLQHDIGYTRAAQGISFDSMKAQQLEINKIVMADPNRKGFFSSRGTVGGSANSGFIFMHLKDRRNAPESSQPDDGGASNANTAERRWWEARCARLRRFSAHHPTVNEVIQELRAKFAAIPGIDAFICRIRRRFRSAAR